MNRTEAIAAMLKNNNKVYNSKSDCVYFLKNRRVFNNAYECVSRKGKSKIISAKDLPDDDNYQVATEVKRGLNKDMTKFIGLVLGLVSKSMLEANGLQIDYKINGEDIKKVKQLMPLDIQQKIELAVKEERYEDAAKLKKLLDEKNNEIKKSEG